MSMAMVGVGAAVLGAGATVYGANQAASAQNSAAKRATNTQLQMYNQTRQDQTPWRTAGGQAVNALSQFYGLGGVGAGSPGYNPMAPITIGGGSHGGAPNPKNDPLGIDPIGSAVGNAIGLGGSAPQQLHATIDPTTGQVTVIGDNAQYRSQALTDYLQTGKGLSNNYNSIMDPVIQQIDQLRASGWTYDAANKKGVAPPGYTQGQQGAGQPPNYQQILENLPGYQFQRNQGQLAVDHNLAARGLLGSGAAVKAEQQYGQGLAQDYAGQYTQGLAQLAGLGQGSVQSTGNIGQATANQIGSNQIYQGNAAASGYANAANAINGGLGNLMPYLSQMGQPNLSVPNIYSQPMLQVPDITAQHIYLPTSP